MQHIVRLICLWSSISVFTLTELFPLSENTDDAATGLLQQAIDAYILQLTDIDF